MKLTEHDLKELADLASDAGQKAGQYIQSQLDQNYHRMSKEGGSSDASKIVTSVDHQAQEIILNHLQPTIEKFDLGVLTEESLDDRSRLEKDHFWCIDPLDGTLPFTEGRAGYAVSIALVSQSGNPLIGCVYLPDTQDCYLGIRGFGIRLNGQDYRPVKVRPNELQVYMDRSFNKDSRYDSLIDELTKWANKNELSIKCISDFGAVRNAIGVLSAKAGCYYKFTKPNNGGGSIWDFAATRLLFEELELPVSDASGNRLWLNDPETTFMNRQGVLYASDRYLASYLLAQ